MTIRTQNATVSLHRGTNEKCLAGEFSEIQHPSMSLDASLGDRVVLISGTPEEMEDVKYAIAHTLRSFTSD